MIMFSVRCTDSSGESTALMMDTASLSGMSAYSGCIKNAWTNCRMPKQGKFHISMCLQTFSEARAKNVLTSDGTLKGPDVFSSN